ncbi:pyridoxal-dependent decarboxylase [Mytilinidion resinicola]|uniref:Pyridoxal-dependent decarboxylase n=1 Tax=Mytilinidion resinicola TaxID=574789 RepID=A0A6A6Z085_9PEZI|nr:pyridoxal-dependent decarboxylase [Mytilinidion resinicola]KAF2813674.1 pyridoxal-dependent decarboxylase [Mytilinidion resinicola]
MSSQLRSAAISTSVLPEGHLLTHARTHLHHTLPKVGLGSAEAISHITEDLAPAFNASSRSPNYYGFVTGGTTPAAALADNLVTYHDQNVAVHLPTETIATEVEDKALTMLCELLKFDATVWQHRIFTTGATASNVLGLALGREYVIGEASAVRNEEILSVGGLGIVEAMHRAGLEKIQILTTVPHSSIYKAASIVGLGRASVKDVSLKGSTHRIDMTLFKEYIGTPGSGTIVSISAGDVNTGLFATTSLAELQELRSICDMHGAWIHVDGAFGLMGRMLSGPEYSSIISGCEGLELADSITGDGHKLLNVPYDCGFYLSRHPSYAQKVFQNPNAAYLATTGSNDGILSPLNVGLENSRRFRALPVYATLLAHGSDGYREMLEQQIALARFIADFIVDSDDYELLPYSDGPKENQIAQTYMIVLFKAKDNKLNEELVQRIKATRKVYVSGTAWEGLPACRFAISNWQVESTREFATIKEVLESIIKEYLLEGAHD